MKKYIYIILIMITSGYCKPITNISNSVVKIFNTRSTPNYKYPWQTGRLETIYGSGAIIKNNQILTAAHVVANARLLQVKKENDPKKYIAHIKYISHQADLALLSIEDKNFFNNTKALKLSTNVKVRDKVTVIGYPIGGKNISTTTGIVSRIEQVYYVYSANQLLAIQIDAAINSGNSGGPTINAKNELIGIAMMRKAKASNIGYIVPTQIINTFLEDTKDGKVDGFYKENIFFQSIENTTLKHYYNLQDDNGILLFGLNSNNIDLKNNDILLAIDGKNIANNGTINTKYGRILFSYIFDTKQIRDIVTLDILRNKKHITIHHKVEKIDYLINYEFAQQPRYIIYGGLVFTPITSNYLNTLRTLESNYIKKKLYAYIKNDEFSEAVTITSTIFPHSVNRGYNSWGAVLKSVNGIKIKSFQHLVSVLEHIDTKYTRFEFLKNAPIILNTQQAKQSFTDIKKIYRLNSYFYGL